MSNPLYRGRQAGPAARVHNDLPASTKRGLAALLTGALGSDQLAEAFPDYCNDGNGVCGTDITRARSMIEALVPDFEWPPSTDDDDGVIFDLVEFFDSRVAAPKNAHWHDFFKHYELEFDRRRGLRQFRDDVNAIFAAGRTVFELSSAGRVERIGTPEVRAVISDLNPNTGDAALDTLIVDARHLYVSPKESDRQVGLEKLWDAFERLKTIEAGKDKKTQTEALLKHIQSEPLRVEVDSEMSALTKIGNSFRIRHHETSKHAVPDSDARDFLFTRMANVIILLLKVSKRLAA